VGSAQLGIDAARAVLRIGGRGHSAAIHSADPATIMAYGAALDVLRISVDAGSSLGSSGYETGLAPSMTVGTGFFGRSSVGEKLQPKHLVQWTRVAYNSDPAEVFGDFAGLDPWERPVGAVPPYPLASNQAVTEKRRQGKYLGPADETPAPGTHPAPGSGLAGPGNGRLGSGTDLEALRAEIRRVIIEELQALRGGDHRAGG